MRTLWKHHAPMILGAWFAIFAFLVLAWGGRTVWANRQSTFLWRFATPSSAPEWMMLLFFPAGLVFALANVCVKSIRRAFGLGKWARRCAAYGLIVEWTGVPAFFLYGLWAHITDFGHGLPNWQLILVPGSILILFAFIAFILHRRALKQLRPLVGHIRCQECGYIVDDYDQNRCPECGHTLFSSASPVRTAGNLEVYVR